MHYAKFLFIEIVFTLHHTKRVNNVWKFGECGRSSIIIYCVYRCLYWTAIWQAVCWALLFHLVCSHSDSMFFFSFSSSRLTKFGEQRLTIRNWNLKLTHRHMQCKSLLLFFFNSLKQQPLPTPSVHFHVYMCVRTPRANECERLCVCVCETKLLLHTRTQTHNRFIIVHRATNDICIHCIHFAGKFPSTDAHFSHHSQLSFRSYTIYTHRNSIEIE